ncbi:hypothetical protein [Novosphingobium colocasiae]|uniref:hypothetical protein n=1 Tax=Novosphingobium colocasiae TaxID=1256513 RepID=UPI0035AFC11A
MTEVFPQVALAAIDDGMSRLNRATAALNAVAELCLSIANGSHTDALDEVNADHFSSLLLMISDELRGGETLMSSAIDAKLRNARGKK